MEVLSRSLKRMSRSVSYGFHPKCRNLRITHLAYADDLLLLSRGDTSSVSMVMQCLNTFGNVAGLRVNLMKSNIYMAGLNDRLQNEILQITGFTPGTLPFRYLGVPLPAINLRSSDYSKLVDAIAAKFNCWPRQSLSYAGKIELVRSVVQGIECFWLSILSIPNCIIDAIYSLCRKFVWPTKHPPIAWNTLYKPRSDGGLGLKNLKSWNKALIAKILWKIHLRKDSLWIRWVNHVYSHFGDVWNWGWHKDESPLIKQILNIRDEMVQRTCSVNATVVILNSWFDNCAGLANAYGYFANNNLINRSCILPKHRFTLWLMAHSKLRTRDRLSYVVDKSCILCKDQNESVEHLFFQCAFSCAVWGEIRNWLGMLKNMGSPTAILRAFRTSYGGKSLISRMRVMALAATVYHIWNARNRAMFDDEAPRLEDMMYRGGKICLTVHFKPLWAKNCPRFGLAHALCLGLAPWLAAEIPILVDSGMIKHKDDAASSNETS